MHAIWFSLIVPSLFAVVWIFPSLRFHKVWLGLALLTLAGLIAWIVSDLMSLDESIERVWIRPFYLLVSETEKPVLQWMLGLFCATIYSWRATSNERNASNRGLNSDEEQAVGRDS